MVCLFDVLEHLPDERGALQALRAVLVPGGALVITVPARRSLWSEVDEVSGHLRRYEAGELEALLDSEGYQVEYLTPFMMSIYPLFWLSRRLAPRIAGRKRRAAPQAGLTHQGELKVVPVLNGILAFLLGLEAPMTGRRMKLPFGTSLLAVARTREETPRA
jgi:SAM-dependent methyltransferase